MLYKIKRVSLLVALILCVASVSVGAATTLQVASWWSFEDGSSLDEFKLAFEAANPDLKINYVQIPSSEYYTKVLTMIAGGTPPDVVMLGMDKLGSWVPRNALQDLTPPYIEQTGFNLDVFFPAVKDAISINNGIYAMPRDTTTSVVVYNKRLFDEAGGLLTRRPVGHVQNSWRRPAL